MAYQTSRLFVILVLATLLCSCSGWIINGMRMDDLRAAEGSDLAKMAGGAALSVIVHPFSHIMYLALIGADWHMDGLYEICDENLSSGEKQWFGRAGFVGQIAGGLLLEAADVDHYFTTGYHLATATEVWTYPLIHPGGEKGNDLDMIDAGGGNGKLEWTVYGLASTAILVKKVKK